MTRSSRFCSVIISLTLSAAACSSPLDPRRGGGGTDATAGAAGGGTPDGAGATGGTGDAPGGTGGATGGSGGTQCPPVVLEIGERATIPAEHRPAAIACAASNAPPTDGGTISCTTDADCGSDGGPWGSTTCLRGVCSFDHCLTDDDCGPNAACACSSNSYGGNFAYHANICVPANCRIDADCGPAGFCSPSRGYCGTFQGFYCHQPTDSCFDPAYDCDSCSNSCVYSPQAATFVCGRVFCAG